MPCVFFSWSRCSLWDFVLTAVLAVCIMAAQAERVIMFSSESVIEGHLFADRVEVSFARFSQLGGTHSCNSSLSMQTESFLLSGENDFQYLLKHTAYRQLFLSKNDILAWVFNPMFIDDICCAPVLLVCFCNVHARWHGSHGDGRNGTPSETQFLRVVRMGFNHTCHHCEHGISKLNEPNASICQTCLANSSPPTTNEAQVEFDHRMLCTLGTFKNHRQVLTSPRYPPRDRLLRQGDTISLLRFGDADDD